MIKENKIEIKIGNMNFGEYFDKYGPYKKYDKIIIDVEDLIENSTVKITTICDICKREKVMKYQPYNIQIKKDGFYCCSKCKMVKTKKTNMKKYGVEYSMQRKDVMEKSKKTLMKNYGIENISQREDIRKIRSDRLKSNDYQQKMLDGVVNKFGVNNVSKLDYIQKEKEKTLMSNYGVTNPSQSEYLFEKAQKSGKKIKYHNDTKLYYRGTYELDFLNYCTKNNINVKKGPTISFIYNDKNKVYHSDYFLPDINLICEIKSNYYYNKYLELNLIKQTETLKNKYNFIFIIDKKYIELDKFF